MSRFCVAPGVNSKVASHLLVEELYTRTIPFCNPPLTFTSPKAETVEEESPEKALEDG